MRLVTHLTTAAATAALTLALVGVLEPPEPGPGVNPKDPPAGGVVGEEGAPATPGLRGALDAVLDGASDTERRFLQEALTQRRRRAEADARGTLCLHAEMQPRGWRSPTAAWPGYERPRASTK